MLEIDDLADREVELAQRVIHDGPKDTVRGAMSCGGGGFSVQPGPRRPLATKDTKLVGHEGHEVGWPRRTRREMATKDTKSVGHEDHEGLLGQAVMLSRLRASVSRRGCRVAAACAEAAAPRSRTSLRQGFGGPP